MRHPRAERANGWRPADCALTPNRGQQDQDGDGAGDVCDNCLLAANPAQVDTDNDGHGNACDPGFDQSNSVGISDFNGLRSQLGKRRSGRDRDFDVLCDANDDGVIGLFDSARGRPLPWSHTVTLHDEGAKVQKRGT